jgi:sulfite dehydrogenase (quinone) subunit SoeC
MHPAYSVIAFTTASGAGYGLLAWLALAGTLGWVPLDRWLGATGFGLAFTLITVGLLSSTAHLGRPERAWRAFSQWRSSWLSREGVMAVATFLPAGVLAFGWIGLERARGIFTPLALLAALCAVVTLFTTGMIYASLRTIRQWFQPLTAPIYVVLGLASGSVLLNALLNVFAIPAPWASWLAIVWLALGAGLKASYWHAIDQAEKTFTVAAATGLGHLGKVRALEPAHTQPNFVMREMGYRIARKHAQKLRGLALLLAFALPCLATLLTFTPSALAAMAGAALAALSMGLGLVVERWLFFAEAEHVAMLYYGADAA